MNKRIFFALWPSQETARELMHWVRDAHALCGGRMMTPETLHLTLAFLGSVPGDLADELARKATDWPVQVGPVTLERYGRFAGPRVVWAGPGSDNVDQHAWLHALYNALWQRLEPYGVKPDHPQFRPHVSLLRRAGQQDLAALPERVLTWMPQRCVLVASDPSDRASRYTVLATLPMRSRASLK